MDPRSTMHQNGNRNTMLYVGIAAGAAVGVVLALTRRGRRSRSRDPWSSAKNLTTRMADHSQDLASKSKDIIERVQNIYEEGRRVAEDAAELWSHGRRLVRA